MESVIFDPEQYLVGKVDLKDLNLPDGVYELARHKDSGLRLWAKIVNGAALCARFTNTSGDLLETVTISIFKPFPDGGPRPEPKLPQPFPCPGGPIGKDGGTDCAYVCTAQGDGGYKCFKVC